MPDPWLELVSPPSPSGAAVAAFTGHVVVAADITRPWLDAWVSGDDFCAPIGPPFLGALEDLLGLHAGNLDVTLRGDPLRGPPPIALTPVSAHDHPRVVRAHRFRSDVRVWSADPGLLIVGRGLGDRWEVAFEVPEPSRNRGRGRALAAAARHLIPEPRPLWAQCAPGNAASLRALLAAGYKPAGAEVILTPFP